MTVPDEQKLRLEWRDPKTLSPNPLNWRRHPEAQRLALKGALGEVGWAGALLYNEATQRLVDGHLRRDTVAASGDGEKVPVLVGSWTEEQERVILATLDPIGAMAEADKGVLEKLLAETSVVDSELQSMLQKLADDAGIIDDTMPEDAGPQIDRAEELQQKWQVQTGDVWEAGEQRLVCGDCTDAAVAAEVMRGEKTGAVVTDPPYGMNLDTDWSNIVGSLGSIGYQTKGGKYAPVIGDEKPFDPAPIFALWNAPEMFLFGADYYAEKIPDRAKGSWLVWDKRKDSQADAIGSEFELVWSKARHKRRVLRHDWFGFLSSENGSDARNRQHPTQKPVSLIEDILKQWVPNESTVADPFLGSGTTLVACHRLHRKGRGIEISAPYCSVTLERLSDMGLTPTLAYRDASPPDSPT